MATASVACNVTSSLRITDAIVPAERATRPALTVMAFWLLIHAFHDASQCRNRLVASHALRWIRAQTDWTRVPLSIRMERWGAPAPPADVRSEYVMSFSWCCSVLSLDEEQTRRHGLPISDASLHCRWLPDASGLSQWRTWHQNRPKPLPRHQRRTHGPRKRLPDVVVPHAVPHRTLPTTRGYPGYVAYCNIVDVSPLSHVQWNILTQ
jgi:hypothetical protein